MPADSPLSFEQPILELESRLEEMPKNNSSPEVREEIQRLKLGLAELKKSIYSNLTRWQVVEVSRHPRRPQTGDYLDLVFDEFVELHGDRFFGDDRALITGWAKLDGMKVMVVGHQKGHTVNERMACNFGCAHPEGYRKAVAKMKLAAKFGLPVICFIDTPGAYPGIASEERGVAEAIAEAMFEMSILPTPIVCVVIGEGGSGGALGIGVGDKVAMLQFSYYSVISPEGCSGILWKSEQFKDKAAEALKFTSSDLLKLGVIDKVIEEPLGGAHRDPRLMASKLKQYLRSQIRALSRVPTEKLLDARYKRFRDFGVYFDNQKEADAALLRGSLFPPPQDDSASGEP
ncbi:MAG: acetyl-CoA carboxylase carboxyltransferase subunit alpha [Thermoguttaceae bacterium]|nr:acetyl-CoA carboxylase carboxyltransferase subunit alpha [Thermoguttaceae bacterium]MBR6481207.1 acetyl-CoA carboxylase carboxyltransferase subunit alpha [Thermoguttaceae bacterium]